MISLGVIDYGSGNVRSVAKAFEYVGAKVYITNDPEVLGEMDGIVLPGQGSFGDCMSKLFRYSLLDFVRETLINGKPFLGICVGLQLLFDRSYELGEHKGLGFVRGEIKRFPKKKGFKIPHMGWNTVNFESGERLFDGVPNGSYFYFVHSYYAALDCPSRLASTEYVVEFTSAVRVGNVYGVQFHPEKSQSFGLRVIKNFCLVCEEERC